MISSGLLDENYIEQTLRLKKSFKNSRTYTDGVIYVNERVPVSQINAGPNALMAGFDLDQKIIEVELPTNMGGTVNVFAESEEPDKAAPRENYEFEYGKEVPKNVTRHAMATRKTFRFDYLKTRVVGITSANTFMDAIGKVKVSASGIGIGKGKLTPEQKLFIANAVLSDVEAQIQKNEETFRGTTEFKPKKIAELFKDNIKRRYRAKDARSDREFGVSQKWPKNMKYCLDLETKNWYAYNDNFGTSEEKSLVLTIDGLFKELAENWDDIYLLRNEKAVTIYSFDDGKAFEPDFILLANDKKTGNTSWQIFIEPKGGQLMAGDKWKEDFLLSIAEQKDVKLLMENEHVRVLGLQFYNEDSTRGEIIDTLSDLSKEEVDA